MINYFNHVHYQQYAWKNSGTYWTELLLDIKVESVWKYKHKRIVKIADAWRGGSVLIWDIQADLEISWKNIERSRKTKKYFWNIWRPVHHKIPASKTPAPGQNKESGALLAGIPSAIYDWE